MASSSSEMINDCVVDTVPQMEVAEVAEAVKDKKKKKKEKTKGVDIEDMFSFDAEKLEKVAQKPPRKKKEESTAGQLTLAHFQKTLALSKKMQGGEETEESAKNEPGQNDEKSNMTDASRLFPTEDEIQPTRKQQADEKVGEEDKALLRFPSPSRSRQGSPKKRDESPKKPSLKASAAEFVFPGMSSPAKETSSSGLKASAVEFVPPGFTSSAKKTSSLQASATEFVPPGFESKASSEKATADEFVPPGFESKPSSKDEPKHDTIPPKSETSPEPSCWAHAVLPPPPQQPQQLTTVVAQPPKVPGLALNLAEVAKIPVDSTAAIDETDEKWTARLGASAVGSILGKVKQSLTFSLKLGPNSQIGKIDPSIGKVADKVKKIEEQEADNEAEKDREAAIKAVQVKEESAEEKRKRAKMDETLMDCFLQAVTTRVKDRDLPIMGTTLYGKHMRASRHVGTSCDVKDSSFVWLRPFLESLEEENLLKLKPEVKDPTVTWINRNHRLLVNWEPWAWEDTVGSRQACGPSRRR